MRATPAAPATQPSPNSGTRLTSGRKPTRVASRASRVGTANPVTVVEKTMSTSEGLTLAASNAESSARSPSSSAVSMKIWFASVKPLSWPYCDNGNEMRRVCTPALAPNRSNCGPPKLVRPDSASRWPTRCGGNSIATAATDADGVVLAFPPCTPGVTGPICHRIQVVSRGSAALLVIQFLEPTYSMLDTCKPAAVGDGAAETPVSACQYVHSLLECRR